MEGKWATNCPACNARWERHQETLEGGTVMCRSGHRWRWSESRESAELGDKVPEFRLWERLTDAEAGAE